MHFSQQLIQMTLTHLHGLMEDGATFLEHASNTSHVTVEPQEHVPATCQQLTAPDVEECMRYVSTSIVELRKHLRGASTETGDKVMPTDATRMEAFVGTETDVADWSVKLDATPVKVRVAMPLLLQCVAERRASEVQSVAPELAIVSSRATTYDRADECLRMS